jgi:hypothetical protein
MCDAVADLDHADVDLVADLASIRLAKRSMGLPRTRTSQSGFRVDGYVRRQGG